MNWASRSASPDTPSRCTDGRAVADDDLLTERLLRVIDEGRRTATYKLALLLALMNAAALRPGETRVPTRLLAELVVELYYPQVRQYVANEGITHDLRQITMKGSPAVRAIFRLRLVGDNNRCRTIGEVKAAAAAEYDSAVAAVEDTFVRYPIPLLQVVGTKLLPFLYEPTWPEGTSVATLRKTGADHISFLPGVADRLIVLGPLLRPLVELHWTRDVACWSGIATEDDNLRAHLFGTDRIMFPPRLREHLHEMQDGRCFYCGERLRAAGQIDHFLAWTRWPNNAVENLVLADRCNGEKSDHLAATMHLERWLERLDLRSHDLHAAAASLRWPTDDVRSKALVRSTYSHVVRGVPLWVRGKDFVEAAGPVEVPA